jgi:tetratricopeptide (TPR) repeat protein
MTASGHQRAGRAAAVLLAVAVLGGCYGSMMGPGYRSLHVVEGQVVSSSPPSPSAYEAYLRARLAFEHEPPKLEEARFYIAEAIGFDPRDPQLWATRAEIEERAGKKAEAAAAARRALAIRPGYPLAEQVLARVEGGAGSGATASAPAVVRQP